jgi:TolB-like protein/DNA-binding winged helix-turn-helix (wHTH) protein
MLMSADETRSIVDLAYEDRFHLGEIEVRPSTRELLSRKQREVLEPRVMQVLVALARRRGEVVSRDDLIAWCWSGRVVGEDAINRCISIIRRIARTHGEFSVQTVARVGYRLSPDQRGRPEGVESTSPSAAATPTLIDLVQRSLGQPSPALPGEGVGPPPLPDKPSLAVMPFANLSGDAEQDYFADGMVEEISLQLSRIKSIFVIGSGSTSTFKGKTPSPRDVGRQLGVRYLLEGSVRKGGQHVRIAVKLTEAADGAQLWAERFEGALADVFALQDEVAGAVASRIEPTVETAELQRASRKPMENPGSYDLYLKALPLRLSYDRGELRRGLDLLERSLALDPDFAPALAQLAMIHAFFVLFHWADGGGEEEGHRSRGLELAQRALAAAPDDPAVLGRAGEALTIVSPDWTVGAPFIERAVALNPGYVRARLSHAILQLRRGAPEGAIEDLEAVARLDPLAEGALVGRTRAYMGIARFEQGRFAEAVDLLEGVVARQGAAPSVPAILAAAYGLLGDAENAGRALADLRTLAPGANVFLPPTILGDPKHRRMFEEGVAMAVRLAPASRPD